MKLSPAIAYVRSLSQNFYVFSEVAEQLGISVNALRTLARRYPESLGPYGLTYLGEMKIYLFRAEDVDVLRRYLDRRAALGPALDDLVGGRGRPPIWTHAEQRARHARHAAAYYWSRRVEQLEAAGDGAGARTARRRSDQLSEALKGEYDQRVQAIRAAATPAASA